jgi:hypothetical protein
MSSVAFDVRACAERYRRLAEEYERRAGDYLRAIAGTRVSHVQAQVKSVEYGVLKGKAEAYDVVAKQFEYVVEQRLS